jgi:hypothetical protein
MSSKATLDSILVVTKALGTKVYVPNVRAGVLNSDRSFKEVA